MKADVVIIGGGLSSILAGIKLLKAGKSVIIVSAGQSALHFSSGSFGLMSHYKGELVDNPFEYVDKLEPSHPYSKIGGRDCLKRLVEEGRSLLEESGISLNGNSDKNHFKLTPYGVFSPAWLSLGDHLIVENPVDIKCKKITIIGIKGFLDFFPMYLKRGLEKYGAECRCEDVSIKEFDLLRSNPTEMRAPNIARLLIGKTLDTYAEAINCCIGDSEMVIIPAVVGLNDETPVVNLREKVDCEVYSVATTPNAVPGIRMQIQLRQLFKKLGGWYLLGDRAISGEFDTDNNLKSSNTANLGADRLIADHYILATGSFFSHGLRSTPHKIIEPIFSLDIDFYDNRAKWYDKDFFNAQPFMKFGVRTDEKFICFKNGRKIENLYAIGAVLGGCDPLKEGVGAGVAISSALFVAEQIIKG